MQELILRFLDYFLDKLLWAITDTDPYIEIARKKRIFDEEGDKLEDENDVLERLQEMVLEELDIKQIMSTTVLKIEINKPCIIVRDRPYKEDN